MAQQLSLTLPDTWKRESVPLDLVYLEEKLEPSLCGGTSKGVAHIGMVFQEVVLLSQGSAYKVIAGRRRVQAAKDAGHTTIPAVIFESGTPESILDMLTVVENMARKPNPGVEAEKLVAMMGGFDWTPQDVYEKLGIPAAHVKSRVKLVEKLLPDFLAQLKEGRISHTLAKVLCKLTFDKQRELLSAEKLTVQAAEKMLREEKLSGLLPAALFQLPEPTGEDAVDAMLKGAIATLKKAAELTTNGRKGKITQAVEILQGGK